MPRPKLQPRLYLKERAGRKPEYIIIDGTSQFSTGCGLGDEELARQKLGEYYARNTRPNTDQRDPAQIKIADVMLLYMKDVAPTTSSGQLIGYHSKPLMAFFGKKNLADINGALCRKYWQTRGEKVALSTVRRELTTLQSAVNHWHKESPLAAVPAIVKPDETEGRIRFLSREEAARLLRAARTLRRKHGGKFPHIDRFILIGLYTGTRHDAILGLRWHPSPDAGWLDAENDIIYRMGDAEKKTKKQRTPARIPNRLLAHVRRWARLDLAAGPQTGVIRFRGLPISKERRAWRSVVTLAKLHWYETVNGKEVWQSDVTPHVLKHTCVTWPLNSGMSIWDISALTATSVKTIERVYGHHSPQFQTAVRDAFRRRA